jgi:hypothetical protein
MVALATSGVSLLDIRIRYPCSRPGIDLIFLSLFEDEWEDLAHSESLSMEPILIEKQILKCICERLSVFLK